MFQSMSESGALGSRGRLGFIARTASVVAALALLLVVPAQAQQTGTIAGRVLSNQAQPLGDVVVQVVGTENTALSRADGTFLVLGVAPGTYTVRATYIGYGPAEQQVTVAAGGSASVDLVLQARAVQLEGVVVTGTAIASQRREVGNSIDLITSAEIEASGVSSVEEILRGRIQGLTVSGSSATPGTGSELTIRGLTSINGRTSPLIYVDGVRVGTEDGAFDGSTGSGGAASVLESISPQDIERIEVIKGAAASTLYGTDATAGVIQIFTKRGAPGDRARWTLSTQTSLTQPSFFGPGEDIDPTGLHMNRCDINGPLPQDTLPGPDPDCPASGSWLKDAWSQNYALQVRGGSDDFSYFASGGYANEQGIINAPDDHPGSNAANVFLRANFQFNPFEALQISINNAYTQRDINYVSDGASTNALLYNVSRLEDDETGNFDAQVFLETENQIIDQFTTSMSLNWTPLDNMRHRLNIGFDQSDSERIQEWKRGHFNNTTGDRVVDIETNRNITLDYAGSLLWQIGGLDAYDFTTSWGGQLNDRQNGGLRGDASGFINRGRTQLEQGNNLDNLNESYSAFVNGGFFLEQRIGWNNQVFITAGARIDSYNTVNETLDQVAEYQVFPKLQGTYTVSDHSWWPSNTIETFRLRTAYGVSGDPPPQTSSRTLWDIRETGRGSVGYNVNQIGNTNVGPEETAEFEIGADVSAFNGKVNLSGQYFQRQTREGLIFNDPVPSLGIIEPTPFNAGSWDTWGYEATLDVNVLELDNFRWNMNTTYSYNDNEVNSIGLDEDGSFNLSSGSGTSSFKPGFPFPALIRQELLNADSLGQLPVFGDTSVFLGVNIPPQEISINSSFGIGSRLNIDLFGYGQFGHLLLDGQASAYAGSGLWPACVRVNELMTAWRDAGSDPDAVPGELTAREIGRCDENNGLSGTQRNTSWYDEGDFFRFSSASAQYRLPEEWLPGVLTGATVQFQALNLNLFTDFNGTDPDAIRGAGLQQRFREVGYVIPLPRTYSLNLRLNF